MNRLFGAVTGLTNQPQGLDVGLGANTDKKWATGEITTAASSIIVTGLAFTPKTLVVFGQNTAPIGGIMHYTTEITPYNTNANGEYIEGDFSAMTTAGGSTLSNLWQQHATVTFSSGGCSVTGLPSRKYRWVLFE